MKSSLGTFSVPPTFGAPLVSACETVGTAMTASAIRQQNKERTNPSLRRYIASPPWSGWLRADSGAGRRNGRTLPPMEAVYSSNGRFIYGDLHMKSTEISPVGAGSFRI